MKKITVLILVVFLFCSIFAKEKDAGSVLHFDFVFSKPANTTSYLGTFGISYGLDIKSVFEVKNLSLRPKAGISLGAGIVKEKIGLVNVESNCLYTLIIPDLSFYYYLRELKETTKEGILFYFGGGILMPIRIVSYSDDRFTDIFTNDFPFPTLKFGFILKEKYDFELNLSAPSSLSFGFIF
uniref:Uncharacterized protein n=1 Tax=candidate division WOR-3 bacterium TaxID=2052148 RepID=A0A7C3N4U6_UNCW3